MDKNEIIAILRNFKDEYALCYGISEIGLFGSIARDQSSGDGDVDVCIKTETPDPFVLAHIKDDIENRINQRVDIVRIREKMRPFIKARIEKEGIYV